MENTKLQRSKHEPVLVDAVVDSFGLGKNAHLHYEHEIKIIDATVGSGGHAMYLINRGAKVLGVDRDSDMLKTAKNFLESACPILSTNQSHLTLAHGNFRTIDTIADKYEFSNCDGILLDLGVNTLQLVSPQRGLSFDNPQAQLDMRLDTGEGVTAAILLNSLPQKALIDLFAKVVDFKEAHRIALGVVSIREQQPFVTVGDFLTLFKPKSYLDRIHPSTKAFLALRIAVNSELEDLAESLPKCLSVLRPGGILTVISFHSLEDKIVKNFGKDSEVSGLAQVITYKPIEASEDEKNTNPRSRSARMRIIKKV